VLDKCPHCGGTEGYTFIVVSSYTEYHTWDGQLYQTGEGLPDRYRKTAHCVECEKQYRISTLERLRRMVVDIDSH